MSFLTKFDQLKSWIWPTLGQIRLSNLVEFKFRDQIWPRIRISNSTFLFEFRIIFIRIRNSSELTHYTILQCKEFPNHGSRPAEFCTNHLNLFPKIFFKINLFYLKSLRLYRLDLVKGARWLFLGHFWPGRFWGSWGSSNNWFVPQIKPLN